MKLFGRKKAAEQVAVETGPRIVLEVEGMHCSSCGLLIDDELEEIPGVRSASTDLRSGRSTVLLEDGAEIDPDVLVAAVQNAGEYTARPVG
ncbi:heavy-metal-associated domain-containing protein [Streptomyces sp. H27-S2]|uniref:heavy-metal-associated domain-containing protein n=1 Tax=Streptomyces antarcticus TaxID=2996458 RepID=UPI00226E8855|nr:heavy metal-associated domain-containing protein [Streptomyces sp. H27-S2]MCY0955152.1 heavy metal-associated domain-containing protein [Streptomyces sp. H27-S2]